MYPTIQQYQCSPVNVLIEGGCKGKHVVHFFNSQCILSTNVRVEGHCTIESVGWAHSFTLVLVAGALIKSIGECKHLGVIFYVTREPSVTSLIKRSWLLEHGGHINNTACSPKNDILVESLYIAIHTKHDHHILNSLSLISSLKLQAPATFLK